MVTMMGSGGGRRSNDALALIAALQDPAKAKAAIQHHKDAEAAHLKAAEVHKQAKAENEASLNALQQKQFELDTRDRHQNERDLKLNKLDADLVAWRAKLDALTTEINQGVEAAKKSTQEAAGILDEAHKSAEAAEKRHVAACAREAAVLKRENAAHTFVQQMKAG